MVHPASRMNNITGIIPRQSIMAFQPMGHNLDMPPTWATLNSSSHTLLQGHKSLP